MICDTINGGGMEMKNDKLCLIQLTQLKKKEGTADGCLAAYILDNQDKISQFTIQEIAENTHTSYATVCRFIKRLGVEGIKEFKQIMRKEPMDASRNGDAFSEEFLSFSQENSFETISKRICQFASAVVEESCRAISRDSAEKMLACFRDARHIHFFGLGTSSVSAQYAYIKFFRIKPSCSYSTDVVISKMMAAMLGEGDILFVFSSSGRTKSVIESARLAKKQGAIVIAVSDFINTPLTSLADFSVYTTVRDANKYLDADFPLIQGQITILDILYQYVYHALNDSAEVSFRKTMSAVENDKYTAY